MEIVKVIITKTSKPTYWYANKLGQTFECYLNLYGKSFQVVSDTTHGYIETKYINIEDCISFDTISHRYLEKFKFC